MKNMFEELNLINIIFFSNSYHETVMHLTPVVFKPAKISN